MILKLFKKHCAICDKEVDKQNAETQFGKYFCSKEHVEEYRKKLEAENSKHIGHAGGGCCA